MGPILGNHWIVVFSCAGGQAYTFKMAFSNNTSLDNDVGGAA